MNKYIIPKWPAPLNIKAYTTTRAGGFSNSPYNSFNLNLAVGDNPENVLKNRLKLIQDLNLPSEPFWLIHKHSNTVVNIEQNRLPSPIEADASFSSTSGDICTVMTADCIPILVCDDQGSTVAAIHAGWKGIANGIITNTVNKIGTEPRKLLAWLGPAIGPESFLATKELHDIFCKQNPENSVAFIKHQDRFLANIYQLARTALISLGISQIYGGEYCTFNQKDLFYSYRRDGKTTGRMASLIWIRDRR